jgi:hypothetical protein
MRHAPQLPSAPTPEEIAHAMKRADRLRARVFRDLALALAESLARIDRERKVGPVQAA